MEVFEFYNSENALVIVAAMKCYIHGDLQSVWLIEVHISGRLFREMQCG